jgi:hypothetical protein
MLCQVGQLQQLSKAMKAAKADLAILLMLSTVEVSLLCIIAHAYKLLMIMNKTLITSYTKGTVTVTTHDH